MDIQSQARVLNDVSGKLLIYFQPRQRLIKRNLAGEFVELDLNQPLLGAEKVLLRGKNVQKVSAP